MGSAGPRCLLYNGNVSANIIPKSSHFSTSVAHRVRSSELTDSHFTSLRAKPDRLWLDIHDTARWGTGKRYGDGAHQTGMRRLSLSDADKQARAWFTKTTEALSCDIYLDDVGNQFAIRPGRKNNYPATFAGSHLDTQPTGGRFDGVLGVCAGIEMLKLLEENDIETEGPVGVINWTNEEGARFPKSMMGSGVWSGKFEKERVYAMKEVGVQEGNAKSVREELDRIGALGKTPAHWEHGMKLGAHFELHIEQGPHLVSAGENVGVVEGAQAYSWFTVNITGRDCHTGTTPFEHRVDALYLAACLIKEVRGLASEEGGLASVGIIKAEPGSVNTVPGKVTMSLDIRHHKDEKRDAIIAAVEKYLEVLREQSKIKGKPGVKIDLVEDFSSAAVRFDSTAILCVSKAASAFLQPGQKEIRRMTSGAGHDSVFTSMRCPTAMLFVPCEDGVSHHPEEWCDKEHCATGASVLTEAVLRYDQIRYRDESLQ